MKFGSRISATLAFAVTATAICMVDVPAIALTVTRPAPNILQQSIVTELLGPDLTGLSNFQLTTNSDGSNNTAFGIFNNDTVFGLGRGVVLSTGNAINVTGPNNNERRTSGSATFSEIQLSFDSDARPKDLYFQYVFGSEEFPEFVSGSFNDSFELLLNGNNLARLKNGNLVTVDNLFADKSSYVENPFGNAETQLDGFSDALTFRGTLLENAQNNLIIRIADQGITENDEGDTVTDTTLDSAAFIRRATVQLSPPPPPELTPGRTVPTPALLPGLICLGVGALRKRKTVAAKQAVEA